MPGSANTQFAVAVHVLTYLSGVPDDRPVSSDELASSVNVNPVHIRRVLGPLRRGGLVRSRSGAGGGWTLALPAGEIGLDQVWSLVRDEDPVITAHGPNPQCPVGARVLTVLEAVERSVSHAVCAELARVSISDVRDRTARALEPGPV